MSPVLKVPALKDGIRTILREQKVKEHGKRPKKVREAAAHKRAGEEQEKQKALEEMKAGFEWVTPEIASQWLEAHNLRNRRMRKPVARKYARMMAKGDWKPTGDAICFDVEGTLLNGQHRLEAVAQSGRKAYMLVVHNLPKESQLVMDRNFGRQAWESINLEGLVGTNKREESIARAVRFHGLSQSGHASFEPTDIRNFLVVHAVAMNFILDRIGTKSMKLFPAPVVGALVRTYYAEKHDRLTQFLDVYMTGITSNERDRAAVLLREFMLENRSPSHRLHASGGEPFRVKQYKKTQAAVRAFFDERPIAKLQTPRKTELFPFPEEIL